MGMKNTARAALAAAVLILAAPALAQNAQQLVERYSDLAGSPANAKALVTGLRDSSSITLTSGGTNTTIDPPTQKMGFGNIDNALALTEASLQKQGITDPTPEQLKSSLLGVLQQRADGKGWGEIANSMGFKLGELKRSERAQPELRSANADSRRGDHVEGVARADRPERPMRPERPDKPERPQR
jgi:hypothetical protein